jgi:hypothetical protein
MALTRDFKELVQKRIARDAAFGDALLREGIDTMLSGDVDTGKAILRDTIKATVGLRKVRRGNRHPGEEPHPHARPARQSPGAHPVRHHWFPAKAGRRRAARRDGAGLIAVGMGPARGTHPGIGPLPSKRVEYSCIPPFQLRH